MDANKALENQLNEFLTEHEQAEFDQRVRLVAATIG